LCLLRRAAFWTGDIAGKAIAMAFGAEIAAGQPAWRQAAEA